MEKELRYLPFQGGDSIKNGFLGKQRAELEVRANYIRRVQQNPDTYIDPVLRFHLGLDPGKPAEKK